jgi:hypothetical protein
MNSLLNKIWRGALLGLFLAGAAASSMAGTLTPTADASIGNDDSVSLIFGNQALYTGSAAQTVTLTTSGGSVVLYAVGVESPNFTVVNNNCAAPLTLSGVGATCTFQVIFTPIDTGARYGEVVIRSDATNSAVVYLQGYATGVSPDAPIIGTAIPGNTTASVAFTPGSPGSGTLVNYTADCGGHTNTGNSSPIVVNSLVNLAVYSCKVKTTTTVGDSVWSGNASVTPSAGTSPTAPTIGTVTSLNGAARVAFTPNAIGSGSLVNYTADCGGATNTGGTSPIVVSNLTNGVSVACKVKTTSTVGSSVWSSLVNVTPNLVLPAAPTIGTASPANNSASVAFTPGAIGSGTLLNHTADCGGGHTNTGSSSPIVVSGLSNGVQSTCRVMTTSTDGPSLWSGNANVTPSPGTAPSAPTITTVTAGNGSASVAFTPGAIGSGTLVSYTADCGGVTNSGSSSPRVVTGLTNGVSVACKVKTTSTVDSSAWSAPVNVTPSNVTSCGNLTRTNVSVQTNYNSPGNSYQQRNMVKGQAYTMSFTTGPSPVASAMSQIHVAEYAGAVVKRTMKLSETPCDFSASSLSDVGTQPNIFFSIGKTNTYGYPIIKTGTTYYINLKNEDALLKPGVDSCPAGSACGFVMTMYGTK